MACLLPVAAMAQEPKAMINGTVDYATPTTVYTLYYYYTTGTKVFDSSKVVNGKFALAVPFNGLAVSVMMYVSHSGKGLQMEDARDVKSFLIDKNGTDIHIKDSVKTAVLSNNALEAEKEKYIRYTYVAAADSAGMGRFINNVSPVVISYRGNAPDSVTDKANYERYQKMMAAFKKRDEFIQQKLELQRRYIKAYPDSYFSYGAVEDVARYGNDPEEATMLYKTLSERLRKSAQGAMILASLEKTKDERLHPEKAAARLAAALPPKPLADGTMAPEFTQFNVDGKPVKLSDFKGKYVLLDFWASWCVPCRKENPNVVKAYNQYKDRNFTVLGIALEEKGSKTAWVNAIKKDGLIYPQVADIEKGENPVAKAYGVSGIPYNFLIDPTGRIIASNLRAEQLLDKLAEILAN